MAILQLPTSLPAQVGIFPETKKMVVTDNLVTLTTPGYLNAGNLQGFAVNPTDIVEVTYNANPQTLVGTTIFCSVSLVSGLIVLTPSSGGGSGVVLPTTANHIATYTNAAGGLSEDPATAISAGNIQAGVNGTAGTLILYPSSPNSGNTVIAGSNNANSGVGTLLINPLASSTTFNLTAPVITPNLYVVTSLTPPALYTETVTFSVSVSASDLNGTGFVNLISSGGSRQFVIISLNIGSNGTNFSGGDKLLSISDGTNSWSLIPALALQTLANTVWGGANLPFPASIGLSTPTQAGANLRAIYSGGTTNYAAGNITISGIALRIA